MNDAELIAIWKDEPAPLLPMLHAFHDRDGFLSESALRAVSDALDIPIADLFGTVTFYHHFSREPGGLQRPRVCTGNVCRLRGAEALLEALRGEGAQSMPCSGRCDESGIPVLRGHVTEIGTSPQNLSAKPSDLPVPNPGGAPECVFSAIRLPGRATLSGYRSTGGFEGLIRALKKMSPAEVIALITESKLAGRGGAGFPTGVKWKAVAEASGQPNRSSATPTKASLVVSRTAH